MHAALTDDVIIPTRLEVLWDSDLDTPEQNREIARKHGCSRITVSQPLDTSAHKLGCSRLTLILDTALAQHHAPDLVRDIDRCVVGVPRQLQ